MSNNEDAMTYPTLLSIAGSDSIGGAGIQADIKAAMACGVYAMTCITAVTAQNTLGVRSIFPVSPAMVASQLDTIAEDVIPGAVKIGMLPDAAVAKVVAAELLSHGLRNIVCDPVMVATSGDSLSEDSEDFLEILPRDIFSSCVLITPNIQEAEKLLNDKVVDIEDSAKMLFDKFGCNVLLKGGHLEAPECKDVLVTYYGTKCFVHPKIRTVNSHGTGCALSSAIASGLAKGLELEEAVDEGISFICRAIEKGADFKFGRGHGPLNFFV